MKYLTDEQLHKAGSHSDKAIPEMLEIFDKYTPENKTKDGVNKQEFVVYFATVCSTLIKHYLEYIVDMEQDKKLASTVLNVIHKATMQDFEKYKPDLKWVDANDHFKTQ